LTPWPRFPCKWRNFGDLRALSCSWCFIELETHAVERDICLIATAQRPNVPNKGYIASILRMRETAIYFHFRSKIWHHHRVPRPRFPIKRGNLRRFRHTYACVKRPYFRFRFVWPTDLESMPRVEPPTLIISAKFEVDTNIHRRVTAMLVRIRYVTLWPWPKGQHWTFNIEQWSIMAGHVGNPSTKFEDPTPIRSWLMSYDVRHKPALTMRLEPLRMRRITWPVRRGHIFTNIWNPWPRYVYSLCSPHGSTIKVNWVYGPVLKANAISANAPNHVTCR